MILRIDKLLSANAAQTEAALSACFSAEKTGKYALTDAAQYALLGGGKRIRAFLVNECCRLFGGKADASVPFACALEMIHAYSLIHDDLPCMDNDDYRRGKLSCHKSFDEATALLAGDMLLPYAFEVLAADSACSDRSVRLATAALANAAGALGVAGGQDLDRHTKADSYEQLVAMYRMKTGALLRAACLCGYYAATDHPEEGVVRDLTTYAESLGLAFQLMDDLLDVTGTDAGLGKPVGSDAKNGKVTAVSFFSAEAVKEEAQRQTMQAVQAVSGYTGSDVLCQFAVWLLSRQA